MHLYLNSDSDFVIHTFIDGGCNNKRYNDVIVMIMLCKEIYEMTNDDKWWWNLGDLDNGRMWRVI